MIIEESGGERAPLKSHPNLTPLLAPSPSHSLSTFIPTRSTTTNATWAWVTKMIPLSAVFYIASLVASRGVRAQDSPLEDLGAVLASNGNLSTFYELMQVATLLPGIAMKRHSMLTRQSCARNIPTSSSSYSATTESL